MEFTDYENINNYHQLWNPLIMDTTAASCGIHWTLTKQLDDLGFTDNIVLLSHAQNLMQD